MSSEKISASEAYARTAVSNHEANAALESAAEVAFLRGFQSALRKSGVDSRSVFYPGSKILEVGAGPGHNQAALRKIFPGLAYTEVDVNPLAREISLQRNPEGTVVTGDIFDYIAAMPADSVDAVLGFNSFDQYSEPQLKSLARNIHRVLKKGGIYVHGINQNQAPLPMMSYLRNHRRTPDGSIQGRPVALYTPVGEGGFTTGSIYLGTRRSADKIKLVFEKLRRDASKVEGRAVVLPDPDACIISPGSFDIADKAIVAAGMVRIPHNKLLQDILKVIFGEVGFDKVSTVNAYGTQVTRGGRGEQHSILLRGIFERDEMKREYLRWEQALSKRQRGITRRFLKSVHVDALRTLYTIAQK